MQIRSMVPGPIRKVLRKGLNAVRPQGSVDKKFAPSKEDEEKWILDADIRTVLDIGAHIGDFSQHFRTLLPNATIYAFEPLPGAFAQLLMTMNGDGKFTAFQCALGDESDRVEMEKNEFAYSSSLLTMADRCRAEFPFTAKTKLVSVEVKRLDDFASEIDLKTNILIKIDVQGFEDRVLRGGEQTIAKASVVILEASFVELYKGQPLFAAIYNQMRGLGFAYAGNLGQLRSPANGMPLQQDAIFLRL